MRARHLVTLFLPLFVLACAPGVDVEPVLNDFDQYAGDLRAVADDPAAIAMLDSAQVKRAEAGALAERGKKKEALPLAEAALADARVAFEMEQMGTSAHRADKCRYEVEQSRTKWSEAVAMLVQTEEFVGKDKPSAKLEPTMPARNDLPLPESTLEPANFPPTDMNAVDAQWKAWRSAATQRKVGVADLESRYRRYYEATQAEKVDAATETHNRYLAARTVQAIECRVRTATSDGVCGDAAQQMADYADAREQALRAMLELERTLQDDLRRDLSALRAEAKSRQEELYGALSQMEGKFASIRQDARGTIVSLADILFDFNQATLRREVEFNLVKIATILNQFPEMKVVIEGHTDSIGTEEYNLQLSQKRAEAVRDFLASQGVPEGHLSYEGYGESRPVADNDTDEGRQKNRRVDLVIQDAP